jgi:hypothetical protein
LDVERGPECRIDDKPGILIGTADARAVRVDWVG